MHGAIVVHVVAVTIRQFVSQVMPHTGNQLIVPFLPGAKMYSGSTTMCFIE